MASEKANARAQPLRAKEHVKASTFWGPRDMARYHDRACVGSGLWARPRRTAFQSLVEGVSISRKIWAAKERSPAGEMEQSSRNLVREGWNWNLPVVMRWA